MRRPLCVIFLIFLAVLCGYYGFLAPYSNDPYLYLDKEEMTFTGKVSRKEKRTDYEGDTVTDIYIKPAGQDEEIWVQLEKESLDESKAAYDDPCETGETLTVSGQVRCFARATNPGEFDSYEYYATAGILFKLKNSKILSVSGKENFFRERLYRFKCFLCAVLDNTLSQKDSGIMRAMLLGERSAMDDEIKELYQKNGIMHILAVSGLHVSVIGMSLSGVLKKLRIPAKASFVITVILMYVYGLICGMSTSAVRAIVMFILRRLSPFMKRTYDTLSAMSVCGIMILLDEPSYSVNSGFLMSFGAICALGIMLPLFEKIFFFMPKPIQKNLIPGVCVSFTSLPVYMCSYYTFPLLSLIINPVVIPLMSLLMPLGIVTVALGAFNAGAGRITGYGVHVILSFYESLCGGTLILPGSVWYAGAPSKWQVALFYVVIGAAVIFHMRKPALKKVALAFVYFFVTAAAVFILSVRTHAPLTLTALDVGQGDCLVIRAGDKCYMTDGGSTSNFSSGKYQILPYLKHEGIAAMDGIIVSHGDDDHVSGIIEILKDMGKGGITVKQVLLPAVNEEGKSENYLKIEELAREENIPLTYLHEGLSWETDIPVGMSKNETLSFTCLAPGADYEGDDSNAASVVLRLECGIFNALLTGDTQDEGLECVKKNLKSRKSAGINILKVAHHGSRNNTDEELLDFFDADVAVISCGENNMYGHPHSETLELLKAHGIKTYITYETGALTFSYDGKSVSVREFNSE